MNITTSPLPDTKKVITFTYAPPPRCKYIRYSYMFWRPGGGVCKYYRMCGVWEGVYVTKFMVATSPNPPSDTPMSKLRHPWGHRVDSPSLHLRRGRAVHEPV